MSRLANGARRGPKALDLLHDFLPWLLNDVPERQPKYAYLSLLVIIPVFLVLIALCVWFAVSLPWWMAMPMGIAAAVLGFLVVVALVGRILPKKLPADREF